MGFGAVFGGDGDGAALLVAVEAAAGGFAAVAGGGAGGADAGVGFADAAFAADASACAGLDRALPAGGVAVELSAALQRGAFAAGGGERSFAAGFAAEHGGGGFAADAVSAGAVGGEGAVGVGPGQGAGAADGTHALRADGFLEAAGRAVAAYRMGVGGGEDQ